VSAGCGVTTTLIKQGEKQTKVTLDVTGAENHCTILTIAPSPVQRGVVWVGTDDGRVQLTRDGGRSWRSVEDRIPGLPRNTWCPEIKASRFAPLGAFAVFDGHRRADWTPYAYRTDDGGETWTPIATKELDGYCLSIEQDPVRAELLFLGTEFGLWFSIDAGASWQRWKHGVPTSSVMGLLVHPRDGDLVVATHGRSLFVLDDITPLRTLTPAMLQEKLHVFPAQPAAEWIIRQTPAERFPGQGVFRGETRTRGVFVYAIVNAEELAHPDDKVERERKSRKPKPAKDEAAKDETAKPAEAKDKKDKKKEEPKDQVTVEVRDSAGAGAATGIGAGGAAGGATLNA